MDKLNFLQEDFIELLKTLPADAKGQWGVMNGQQMVEHMSESVRIANGRFPHTLHTPASEVDKWHAFALSDKEFKPDTKNALLDETPAPIRNPNMDEAIKELQREIGLFIEYFKDDQNKTVTNPF